MRKLLLIACLAACQLLLARAGQRINPIIGDQSFIAKYGYAPNEHTSNQLRIATHLEYAEYVLRSKDVSGLSTEQIQKRTHLLDLLHAYWTRGIFPKNDDVANERRPCFIDREGTICAVGYLVEQTAGHDAAELIGERFMYEEILDMNDPVVLNWIEECGLTREECAVIQPTYDFSYREKSRVVFSYGAAYRTGDQFYHTFRLMHENATHNYWFYKASRSVGVQFDWLYNGDYSAGIRYGCNVKSKIRHGDRHNVSSRTTVALMPELFVCNGYAGMNLKPDLGYTRSWDAVSVNLSYAYAIPLVNEEKYLPARHEIALRLGVDLARMNWKVPKRKKTEQNSNGQALR